MAGRIVAADIAAVRERVSIVEVIGGQVTLRPAGGGNLKGLCPFHEEKSPSFNVTPQRGVFYCFGCGKGGDAISFLMETDHLTFSESVERLAGMVGITLRYEESGDGSPRRREDTGSRRTLVAAHAEAAAFYAEQLGSAGARTAREFLAQRGFDRDAAVRFGCGFAPDAWDALGKHLRAKGYAAKDLITAGLIREARSGNLIDRFRGRLIWPIRDLSGDVIGFGARKLFDHDDGPKYLNTPETPIYKKSHVLYGIDQAKREIAKQNKAVIVEGYTDVMACHLAGVPTAVATCGTAFGDGHISVLRRLLLDSDAGTIVFTFDGDAAGQKAALRAFADDHKFAARSMVAIGADNMDPCELRLAKGDAAVRDLIADSERLINFALRTTVQGYDLDSAEGQAGALRAGARMVADIKQRDLRDRYVGFLARHVGVDTEEARAAVGDALRHGGRRPEAPARAGRPVAPAAVPNSRRALVEREALKLAVQHPQLAGPLFDAVDATPYGHPVHAAVREAIAAAGGAASAAGGPTWIEQVRSGCVDLAGQALVTELAVEPLRYDGEPDPRYVSVTLASLQLPVIEQRIKAVKSKLQRTNPVQHKDEYLSLFGEVASLEQHAQALREQATGGL
jgi:DNA primase